MTKVMAIINTSPDSFNGDGIDIAKGQALKQHIQTAIRQGADILDIGGQSTRPGADIISDEEEISRVIPAISLAKSLCDLPVSIDTFKPAVAQAAIKAGANIVNDIHGCDSPEMIRVLQRHTEVDVVIMHSRGTPKTMSSLTQYETDVVEEVKQFLIQRAAELEQKGIHKDRIIIDPGIGFAKTAPQSFELTRRLSEFKGLGYRILYGGSQKSFLGKALAENDQIPPPEQRNVATTAVQSYAMLQGIDIIRVHNVKSAIETRAIIEAIQGKRKVIS